MVHRTIFFGSPEFAVPSLHALAADARFDVTLIVTQPDRPSGRGRRLVASPVKTAAAELKVPIWQPDTLRSSDSVEHLTSWKPDLFVVVAYGQIFRRKVLEIPRCGCLNVHPSLLPRYRGSSPIQAAILNGDRTTGVSIIEMVRKLDAGPIIAQRPVSLDGRETAGELSERLADLAAMMLPEVADAWCAGTIQPTEQDEDSATFTRELTKADGRIDWTRPALELERKVRAYNPWPTAWTSLDRRRLVVHSSEVWPEISDIDAGSLFERSRSVLAACGSGSLRLVEVQPEGRPRMRAEDWYRGVRTDERPRFDID